jgi:hypothetical protein
MHALSSHYHSLLHLAISESANVTNHLASIVNVSKAQKRSNASFSIGIATVANVQVTPTDVPHASDVFLATTWVDLYTAEGCRVKVRALFNQRSVLSFIFESLCRTLQTTGQCTDLPICNFGKNYTGYARSKVVLGLTPCNKWKPMFPLTSLRTLHHSQLRQFGLPNGRPHLRGLSLVDPNPASREPIYLLIRTDLYGLLLGDLRQGPLGTPTALNTELGWIISDPVDIGLGTVRV